MTPSVSFSSKSFTIPGGGVQRPHISFAADKNSLNSHYNTTMRQMQSGLHDDNGNPQRDSVSGGLSSENNNPLLRPDTLSGANNANAAQLTTVSQQASWLQQAELLNKDQIDRLGSRIEDTISAAGPDAVRHADSLSVPGSPYFLKGSLQETIQAVGVTVSGGMSSLADTIHGFYNETAPFGSYSPLKDDLGALGHNRDDILLGGDAKNQSALSGKDSLLDPHHKDGQSSLVDLLHQVDHQVTIDLGKYSGVASAEEISKLDAAKGNSIQNAAHSMDEAFSGKTSDDALVTLLDEEQRKRMATNISFSGPFGKGF